MRIPLVTLSLALALMAATVTGQSPTRTPLAVPDIPGYRTLKADFHLHTVFSDGNVWPTVHVMDAWRDGLDVIALTEHAEYHPHADDVTRDRGRSYEIARPLADRLGLILVPGVEITKPDPYTAPRILPEGSQHFNALFVADFNALTADDLFVALRTAREQQAFVFWNHPGFRVAEPRWFPAVARAHAEGLFQGMELVNGPDFYEAAYPWIDEKQLTIIATSDAHDPVPPPAPGTHRPVTLVFARSADRQGVREALFARRTAAWMNDEVWGAEAQLRPLWDASVTVDQTTTTGRPTLLIHNTSAIPMRVRIRKTPDWLLFDELIDLAAGRVTLIRPTVTEDAPPGRHDVPVDLDVENLHVGPGRALATSWTVSLSVAR